MKCLHSEWGPNTSLPWAGSTLSPLETCRSIRSTGAFPITSSLDNAQHKQNASELEQGEKHLREERKRGKGKQQVIPCKRTKENQCTETGRAGKRDKIRKVKPLCKQGAGGLLGFHVHCACAQMLFMQACQNQ